MLGKQDAKHSNELQTQSFGFPTALTFMYEQCLIAPCEGQ